MTRNAQLIADRLRAALASHARAPRHRHVPDSPPAKVASVRSVASDSPGEEFARRLRAAIDA